MPLSHHKLWHLLIPLLAGICLTLAFAPFHFYFFAFFSPALLLFIWLDASPRKAMLQGALFGLGFFSTGTSWVYISIHTFGNAPIWLAILITGLMIIVLSLYPATQGYVLRKFYSKQSITWICLGFFPASWVVWEWLRGTLLSGFPWLLVGNSQINTPLRGFAPLIGVYGISFFVTIISGCLVLLMKHQKEISKILSVIVIFAIIGCGALLSPYTWTQPASPPLRVSLIQGNIAQSLKWDPQQATRTLELYKELTEKNWSSDLIIWPEAAAPIFYEQAPDFFKSLDQEAKIKKRSLLLGIPILSADHKAIYNGMLLIGRDHGQYLKRHLVPFGEYVPFSKIFSWFFNYFQIPLSNLDSGPAIQAPLRIQGIQLAPFICYEIAFPNEVLTASENSQLIVVLIDDSWFGDSIALQQHLQISQMRAQETQRYVLLATNTGITAVINPKGEVVAIAPIDKTYVLTTTITPMKGKTPLMVWRYYFLWIAILLLILVGLWNESTCRLRS